MTINYGKRNPGGLTAASPGDTLYIPLQFYNDSGASISIGATLAKTDIELFKNGGIVERATDSGYAVLGDTGNFDNRIGFKGVSITLFNTADDTGFYDIGSQYWVAIDSATVDARTVRFFPAIFEIGETRANIIQIDGDTGAADRLGKLAGLQLKTDGTLDTGSGQIANTLNITASTDTGAVNNAIWNGARASHVTAGTFGGDMADTGEIVPAVWTYQTRALTAFAHDTGTADAVWKYTGRKLAVDTGIGEQVWSTPKTGNTDTGTFGEELAQGVNIVKISGDTGAAKHLQQLMENGFNDTGINERLGVLETTTAAGATAAALATVDTVVDAIKAKTDSLTFTVASQVDANIQYVNDVAIAGTGDTGTNNTWRPA